jgi:hypothetical protein
MDLASMRQNGVRSLAVQCHSAASRPGSWQRFELLREGGKVRKKRTEGNPPHESAAAPSSTAPSPRRWLVAGRPRATSPPTGRPV